MSGFLAQDGFGIDCSEHEVLELYRRSADPGFALGLFERAALEAPPAVAVISRIADGFKAFQTLRAGYGSGLFDWLEHNGPAEKSTMATALGLRGAHLGGFLQALEDLGLLARQGNNYALVPQMRAALISDSPWCQAAAVDGLCCT